MLHLPAGKIRRLHVSQPAIRKYVKHGVKEPVLSVNTSDGTYHGERVDILDDAGKVVASLISSLDKPLSCGARGWIQSRNALRIS